MDDEDYPGVAPVVGKLPPMVRWSYPLCPAEVVPLPQNPIPQVGPMFIRKLFALDASLPLSTRLRTRSPWKVCYLFMIKLAAVNVPGLSVGWLVLV